MSERRDDAMLTMLYKVKNNLSPDYLRDLLPLPNQNVVWYNLRNNKNIPLPSCRLESFKRSFFPFSINLWNNLPIEARELPSLEQFKFYLHERKTEKNMLFYYGKRWPQVHHSRIRIGCSNLKNDLCFNLHVINDPTCECGAEAEDAQHFF